MSAQITDDLIQEATKLLERWAKKKNLLPNCKRLLVTITMEDSASVSLKMEDKTSSAKIDEVLARPIKTLELSARPAGCLLNGCFYVIGDLVRKTENDFLKLRNFGRKSLREIQSQLKELGLTIDMDIPVGPRERKAVLQAPFDRYVYFKAFPLLEAAGIMSTKDLISKTEDDIVTILKDCDPKEIGSPKRVYHDMRESLRRRGLI